MLKLKLIIITILLLFSFSAYAGPVYMFTAPGNITHNNYQTAEDLINNWFVTNNINYEAELEHLATYDLEDDNVYSYPEESFTFSLETDNKLGSFTSIEPVKFLSVKGGKQYAMYWYEVPVFEGTFSSSDLKVGNGNIPAISHINLWTNNNTYNDNQVPEPATLLLFGSGLIALAAIKRKQYK